MTSTLRCYSALLGVQCAGHLVWLWGLMLSWTTMVDSTTTMGG
jgi:hypothetical protein